VTGRFCEQPLGHPLYENPQPVSTADSNEVIWRFLVASCTHRARYQSIRRAVAARGDRPREPPATVSLVLRGRWVLRRTALCRQLRWPSARGL